MLHTAKSPEREALSRIGFLKLRAINSVILGCWDNGAGCSIAPGERAVLHVARAGENMVRVSRAVAVGSRIVRRTAPLDVPPLPWPCQARPHSDAAKAHAQGGVHLRRLRPHEREALLRDPQLSPITRAALDQEMAARRGSRFWRIIVETRCLGPNETRQTLWSIPPGELSAAINPRNQWAQRMRRNGQVPRDWRRI